ncbi:MAG: putative toxin-antitoxin system toxin component, PIN family [Candidatus Altiarchaeota archaeon]|nr:putative toxin-antitoxin system toxin component, PIN family [Candidatus Altiarchaeota archaeon]
MNCIVADTNILVSAIGWDGNERELIRLIFSGSIRMIVSPVLIEEFKRAASQPKLGFAQDEIEEFIDAVLTVARLVKPDLVLNVVRHPADNRILECALDGNADFIVTGDKDLLALKEFRGMKILTAKEFLDIA